MMESYEPVQLAYSSVVPDDCDEDKAPIIFCHGLSTSKEHWLKVPEIVAKATNRKVHAIDARNHGDSPWSDVFNFDVNADDLLAFMDSIGAPKAVIVGQSMGGISAMKVALKAPERVEKVVVVDMSYRKLPQPILDIFIFHMSLSQPILEQVPANVDEDTAKKMLYEGVIKNLPQDLNILGNVEKSIHRLHLKRTAEGRWAMKSNTSVLRKALQNSAELMAEPTGVYEGPACFIYGKLSPFHVGQDEQLNRKYFPRAQMVEIENAAHSVPSDCPQEFNETLINFLKA